MSAAVFFPAAVTASEGGAMLVGAVLVGLLTSLTPGIYPIIPVMVRTLGPRGLHRSAWVLLYALGTAVALVGLGGAFGALGAWAAQLQPGPRVWGLLSAVCFAMAAAVLGAIVVQPPPRMAARLSRLGGHTPLGGFTMGLASPVLSASWMAPMAIVLLALVFFLGKALFGALLLAAFTLGLGLPWLAVGLSTGRAAAGGVWMEVVAVVLAAVLALVGLSFLVRAAPTLAEALSTLGHALGLGATLVTVGSCCGALMLTSRRLAHAPLLRAGGTVLLSGGLGLALFGGGQVPLLVAGIPDIAWESRHDAGLTRATLEHKPAVLDFTADWCVACKQLERETFVDPEVRRAAMGFVMVKVDCTAMDDPIKALFDRYGIESLPTVIFVDSAGKVLPQPRLTAFTPPEGFVELLADIH